MFNGGKYTPILKSTLPLLLLSMLSGANVYAANDSNLKDVSITISQQQRKLRVL